MDNHLDQISELELLELKEFLNAAKEFQKALIEKRPSIDCMLDYLAGTGEISAKEKLVKLKAIDRMQTALARIVDAAPYQD